MTSSAVASTGRARREAPPAFPFQWVAPASRQQSHRDATSAFSRRLRHTAAGCGPLQSVKCDRGLCDGRIPQLIKWLLVVVAAGAILACADTPERVARKEQAKICQSERGLSDSRCAPRRVISTKDMVLVCECRVPARRNACSVAAPDRSCTYSWVSREDLQRALSKLERPILDRSMR
jgi:hypothetical protein